ncbi:MAG: SLOG family protein, partial [bacterium]|nr:SLOG family protein [bacterium]
MGNTAEETERVLEQAADKARREKELQRLVDEARRKSGYVVPTDGPVIRNPTAEEAGAWDDVMAQDRQRRQAETAQARRHDNLLLGGLYRAADRSLDPNAGERDEAMSSLLPQWGWLQNFAHQVGSLPGQAVGLGIDAVQLVDQTVAVAADVLDGTLARGGVGLDPDEAREVDIGGILVESLQENVLGAEGAFATAFGPSSGLGRLFAVTPNFLDPVGAGLAEALEGFTEYVWKPGWAHFAGVTSMLDSDLESAWKAITRLDAGELNTFAESERVRDNVYRLNRYGLKEFGEDAVIERWIDADTPEFSFVSPQAAERRGLTGTGTLNAETGRWHYPGRLLGVNTPEIADRTVIPRLIELRELVEAGGAEGEAAAAELTQLEERYPAESLTASMHEMMPPGTKVTVTPRGTDYDPSQPTARPLIYLSQGDEDINEWLRALDDGAYAADDYGMLAGETDAMAALWEGGVSVGQIGALTRRGWDASNPETWDLPKLMSQLEESQFRLESGFTDLMANVLGEVALEGGVVTAWRGIRTGRWAAYADRSAAAADPVAGLARRQRMDTMGPLDRAVLADMASGSGTSAPRVTLVPRWMQRRRGPITNNPTRALLVRRPSGLWLQRLGVTEVLTPMGRLTPSERNAAHMMTSEAWLNSRQFRAMDGEIQKLLDDAYAGIEGFEGTRAFEETQASLRGQIGDVLTGKRARSETAVDALRNYFARTYSTNKIDPIVIRALAMGRTADMRANHMRLAYGDPATTRRAVEFLDEMRSVVRPLYASAEWGDARAANRRMGDMANRYRALSNEQRIAQDRVDRAKTSDDPDQLAEMKAALQATETRHRHEMMTLAAKMDDELRVVTAFENRLASEIRELHPSAGDSARQFDLEFLLEADFAFQRHTVRHAGLGWKETARINLLEDAAAAGDPLLASKIADRWTVRGMMSTFQSERMLSLMDVDTRRFVESRVWDDEVAAGRPDLTPRPRAGEPDLTDPEYVATSPHEPDPTRLEDPGPPDVPPPAQTVLPEEGGQLQLFDDGEPYRSTEPGPFDGGSEVDEWVEWLFRDDPPTTLSAAGESLDSRIRAAGADLDPQGLAFKRQFDRLQGQMAARGATPEMISEFKARMAPAVLGEVEGSARNALFSEVYADMRRQLREMGNAERRAPAAAEALTPQTAPRMAAPEVVGGALPAVSDRPWVMFVGGGRDFADRAAAFRAFDLEVQRRGGPPAEVVHGGTRGADSLGGDWARANGVTETVFPADWEWTPAKAASGRRPRRRRDGTEYDPKAGHDRNAEMAGYLQRQRGMDVMAMSFPGGSGTAGMRKLLDQ